MATSQMILFLSSLCTFYVIAILFGASIINQFYQTFLWSLMVTCLITVPPFILLPWEPFTWLQTFLFMEYKSNREFYCSINAVLVLAGSWVGAWFIPLDWESPYQVMSWLRYDGKLIVVGVAYSLLHRINISCIRWYINYNV
jgi:phosphatidylinositol glycan class F